MENTHLSSMLLPSSRSSRFRGLDAMGDDAIRFRALIEATFPNLAILSIRFLAQGWDSTVWEVNDALVFRFPKRAEVAAWLRTEIALLPALAPALPVPIPRFDYIAEPSASYPYPYVGYRKLPGVPLSAASPDLVHTERLAAQIGSFLGALHRFPVAQAVACGVERQTPRSWRGQYTAFLTDVRTLYPRMTVTEQERTERLFRAYLGDVANLRFAPVLLHQDLGGDHILLNPETGDLAGVIDWGDVTTGDPAQDFCGLSADWLPMALAHYGCPVDATFASRVAFYRALAPYHMIRFGLHTGGESFIARGLVELRAAMR